MIHTMGLLQAQAKYGEIHNGIWGNEARWCQAVPISPDIGANWINTLTGFPVDHIYMNKDIIPNTLIALQNIKEAGLIHELKTFDGCFNIRDIRAAPGTISSHSFAISIDINAGENPLGHPTQFTPAFIRCWVRSGFIWGGNFKRSDPMHFTLGW